MVIGVVGLGYLGTTHALAMIQLGHTVIAVDVDEKKIRKLSVGTVDFFEPGLQAAVDLALSSGELEFTTDFGSLSSCDVVFVCVGTPQILGSDSVDLSFVLRAGQSIASAISERTVVVGKSTVPPGTASKLRQLMSREAGFKVHLAWNPEFLRQGSALSDSLRPDRIVVGSWDNYSLEKIRQAYAPILNFGTPLLEMDVASAELVKLAANGYLATKVGFINAIAEVAEVAGADVLEISRALGHDKRIGSMYLQSGIGFGGGCLPKDIRGFASWADSQGVGSALSFLRDIDAINLRRRSKVISLATELLGGLRGKRLLVLGISFKPDSDDIRESPALDIAVELAASGANVTVHDPIALETLEDRFPQLACSPNLQSAARDQQLVILGTEWAEYKSINPAEFGKLVANKLIIDGRNVLDVEAWQTAGWRYIALGRNVHNQ